MSMQDDEYPAQDLPYPSQTSKPSSTSDSTSETSAPSSTGASATNSAAPQQSGDANSPEDAPGAGNAATFRNSMVLFLAGIVAHMV